MSSSKEKDAVCSCDNKLIFSEITSINFVEKLDKNKRYEIWNEDKHISYLEYVDSENRWFFYTKLVEINTNKNGNKSVFVLDLGDNNGK